MAKLAQLRRIAFVPLFLFLFSGISAQVSTYNFSTNTGGAITFTNPVTLITPGIDDGSSPVVNLPFSFYFGGSDYSQFSVNSNGLLGFGQSAVTNSSSNYLNTSPVIAAFWDDLITNRQNAEAGVQYEITGTAPNRKVVIQWTCYNNVSASNVRFQCILEETTFKITLIYLNGSGGSGSIGLRASDYVSVNSITNTIVSTIENSSIFPTPNIAFTFTPPPACAGVPVGGNAVSSVDSTCGSFELSLTGFSTDRNTTYQWQTSTDNITFSNIGNTLILNYYQNVSRYYRCQITCTNSSQSAFSSTVYVPMKEQGCLQNYCVPNGYNNCAYGWYIQNVTTTGGVMNFINSTGCETNGYADYSASKTVSQVQGGTIRFNVSASANYWYNIWVDFNNNKLFEASERLNYSTVGSTNASITISVPGNVVPGTYRMRIKGDEYLAPDACNSVNSRGEAEDYSLIVLAGTPCNAALSPGNTISSSGTVCYNTSFTLSTQVVIQSGLTYQWQSSTNGISFTDIAGSTAGSYSTTQSASTYYRCVITCNGGTSATSNPVKVEMNPVQLCYCIPTGNYTTNNYITQVSTTGGVSNFTRASNITATSYADYSTVTASQYPGQEITIAVSMAGSNISTYNAWVDWNDNGIFETSERVINYVNNQYLFSNLSASFRVPFSAMAGIHRLRIKSYPSTSISLDPCSYYGNGETEDYSLNVLAFTPCAGTPAPGPTIVTPANTSVCQGIPFTLSLNNASITSAASYQWQSSADGVNFNDIPGADSLEETISQTTATFYRCKVTCLAGGATGYSTTLQLTMAPLANCYCIPPVSINGDYFISAVSTTGGVTNFNHTSGGSLTSYADFTSISVSQYRGAAINMQISNFAGYTLIFSAWVDYNDNGIFETGERMFSNQASGIGTSFIIPSNANAGSHRLRIRGNNSAANDACSGYNYGETEDYTLTVIVPPPACSNTPSPGATFYNRTGTVCSTDSFTLSLQNIPPQITGFTYQWQSGTDGINFTNIASATDSIFKTDQQVNTFYRCVVTCVNSGLSANSTPLSISMTPVANCHCIPPKPLSSPAYLTNVSTTGGIANINNSSVASVNGYTDFSNITASQYKGSSINIEFTYTGARFFGWIDYDNNGVFGASEAVFENILNRASFTVPASVAAGNKRFRIRAISGSQATADACGLYNNSETEDYNFLVLAPANCNATPVPGNTFSTINAVCPTTAFTLSIQNTFFTAGITYQWQASSDNINFMPIPFATASTFTTTQSISTYYRCVVGCTATGTSANSTSLQVAMGTLASCYCQPPTSSQACSSGYLSAFSTTGGVTNFTNTSACAPTSFTDYSATKIASQVKGSSITLNFTSSVSALKYSVWVDWNDDGLFASGEKMFTIDNLSASFSVSENLLVPSTAATGTHRMRVRADYSNPSDACNALYYGETEDYSITVLNAADCNGTPSPGTAFVSGIPGDASGYFACSNTNFRVQLTNTIAGAGMIIQWQVSTDNLNFSNVPGGNVPVLNVSTNTIASDSVYYRCYVVCTASGLSATSSTVKVIKSTGIVCYCIPAASTNACNSTHITRVLTTGGLNNFDNASACSASSYTGYTDNVSQSQGGNITLRFSSATAAMRYRVWVDWNDDGSFSGADLVLTANNSTGDLADVTGSFTVPLTATTGSHRMRVRGEHYAVGLPADACGTLVYGETEDYFITVVPAASTACAGSIDPGQTLSNNANPICPGASFVLSLEKSVTATGVSYQWQSSADGITYTDIIGATSSTFNTSQSAATYYRCRVTCLATNTASFSSPLFIDVNSLLNCFCIPPPSLNGCNYSLQNVTTYGGVVNIAKASSCFPRTYNDYSSTNSASQYQGRYLTMLFSTTNRTSVWVDWDNDGSFETAERMLTLNGTNTGTFKIPEDAASGSHRMRVRVDVVDIPDACTQLQSGETEDYDLTVIAAPPCNALPTPGNTVLSGNNPICQETPFILRIQNVQILTGLTFQWQSSLDGTNFSDIPGAIADTFATSQVLTTWYRCKVSCSNSAQFTTSAPLQVQLSTPSSCYCTPPVSQYPCQNNYFISNVAITGGVTNFTNASTCAANSFTNYSATKVASQYRGLWVGFNFSSPGSDMYASVWIDYNDDGVFSNEEKMLDHHYQGSNGSIYIPGDVPAGTHRMRVRADYYYYSQFESCNRLTYGETEDYAFTVLAYPNCGTPAPGNTVGPTTICANSGFTLSLQNNPNITGLRYQWQSSTNGTTYSNLTGQTENTLSISQVATTYYRCAVTCSISGVSVNSNPLLVNLSAIANCYCVPSQSYYACMIYITSVATSGGTTNFTNATGCTASSYSNYSASKIVHQYRGLTVNMSFALATTKSGTLGYTIWVDWNDDGVFSPGEKVATTYTSAASFVVPGSATLGVHRMRVRGSAYANTDINYNVTSFGPSAPYDPCNGLNAGETEDYAINVTALPTCAGNPAPGNTVSSIGNTACANISFTLSLSNSFTTGGITYQWQYSIDGGTNYYNIPGATANTYTTSQTKATMYRCAVTCTASGATVNSTPVSVAMSAPTNCYCTPANGNCTEYITGVSSSGGTANFTNTGTGCAAYTNYSASKTVTQSQGAPVTLTFVSNVSMNYVVWVDFDNDGIFEANEKVIRKQNTSPTVLTLTESFVVPLNAPTGAHRMRVRSTTYIVSWSAMPDDPCETYYAGETEDYALNVTASNACSGTPVAGTTASTSTSVCANIGFTLSITPVNQTGITYQWQRSVNNINYVNIDGANSFTYTTSQTVAYYYRCVVRCANSNATANSTALLINMSAIANCYCTPPVSSDPCDVNGGYISNVVTTGGITNFTNATTCAASSFSNYSATKVASQYVGQTVTFNLTSSVVGFQYVVWIDFDDDGEFDGSEQVGSAYNYSITTSTFTMTVPLNGRPGTHRMRVRGDRYSSVYDPCARLYYGETEDYAFTVLAPVNCSGTPSASITAAAQNNTTICSQGGYADLRLNNVPVGISGFNFQWQVSKNGSPFANITDATAITYQSPVLVSVNAYVYRCVVTCSNSGLSYTTNGVTYTVLELPSISATATEICPTTGSVVLTAKPAGKTYSWSTAGSPVSPSITVNNSGSYSVTVTQSGCTASASISIAALPVPTINSLVASPATICAGDSTLIRVSGRAGNLSNYCNVSSYCGSDYISNVTFGTINRTSACDGGYILVSLPNPVIAAGSTTPLSVTTAGEREGVAVWIDYNQNGTFEAAELVFHNYQFSNPAVYTKNVVVPSTAINGITRMRVRCAFNADPAAIGPCALIASGETEDYLVTITSGSDPLSYTWSPATYLNNTTGSVVSATNVIAPVTYTVTAAASSGCTITQNVSVVVNPLPQGILTGNTICNGGNGMLTFTASAGTGPFTVVYNDGVADRTQNNVTSGVAFAAYSNPSTTTTYTIVSVTATGTGCSRTAGFTAASGTITIVDQPQITQQPSNFGACVAANATFSVTASGTGLSYQWQVSTNNGSTWNNVSNAAPYSGATTNTLTITNAALSYNGYRYRVTITGSCSSLSNEAVLSVNAQTTITAQPVNRVVCAGASTSFSVTSSLSTVTYQWQSSSDGIVWNDVAGAASATYSIPVTTGAMNGLRFRARITSGGCTSLNSNPATLTVNTPPAITTQPVDASVCSGATATFSVVATGTSLTYQWQVSTNGGSTWSNIASAINATYTTAAVSVAQNNNQYRVIINGSCTPSATSAAAILTVSTSSSISTQPQNASVCEGANANFSVIAAGAGLSYQWQSSLNGVTWNNIGGETASSLLLPNVILSSSGLRYRVLVNSSCGAQLVSNGVVLTVTPQVTPSVSIATASTGICAGTNVTFTATPSNGGTAPAYQWKLNGVAVGANSNTYSNASLVNGDMVSCVLTSNANCASVATATSNSITMTVSAQVTPSITIVASSNNICSGTSVTFTATPTNGGATPSYQWKLNGINVGSNAGSYSNVSLANNDVVTCVLTSNAACSSTNTAISNGVMMNVASQVTPSVTIAASATNICAGTNVTFTATPVNGGTTPVYQWKLNGANVGANSNTYSSSALNNGDVVRCELTSSVACASITTTLSNAVTMTVTSQVTPSVTIAASATNICAGTNVTFTATPVNGGTTPFYQWKLNGANVGANSNIYSNNSLSNGDVVTCELNSNASCRSINAVISNSVTITVASQLTPSVSIAASATTICPATSVTFTATAINGGTAPGYQWKLNGVNVGTNTNTYSNNSLTNGDQVACQLTSNANCVSTAVVMSNTVTMTVTSQVTPSITIAASASNICAGTNVRFTATPVNGGTTPFYQWKLNGANVGANSISYDNNSLVNGDIVTCELTSNATCASAPAATSNNVVVTVTSQVTPSVNIAATSTTICAGTSVTFTATPTNGGAAPSYQWKLNGSNVGANSSTYSNSSLADNDVVSCVMTSNANCASTNTATSNNVTITVSSQLTPSVTIVASATTICPATGVTFTATPMNGGTTPLYQWKLNGANVGTNSNIYSTTSLTNGDVVTCVLASNVPCATATTATSNAIAITVATQLMPSISIAASSTSICAGANVTFTATPVNGGTTPAFQWKLNGVNVGTNSSTYTNGTLANGDVVTCVLTSNVACASVNSATSNSITVTVNGLVTPSINITASATTICAGTSVTFTATPINGGATPAYQWKLNGSNVGVNSATYVNSTLANGDVVSCELTSNAGCTSTNVAASNSIAITVNSQVTPSVNITATSTTICPATGVTFTASATNGGTTPVYQWQLNGANVGTSSSVFTTTSLANGDVVNCIVTTNAACASLNTATSNSIAITVTSPVTPSVTITASSTAICSGTGVTFIATPTNGGSNPFFQWKLNGVNVGTNSNSYTNATLINGDVISCVVTSNANCATASTVASNTITMTVTTQVTPSIVITATSTGICAGTVVTFTASPTNGGATPAYQWKLNGANVGTNNSTYFNNALANGDVVSCELTTSLACTSTITAVSNNITMTVAMQVTPSITIAASSVNICSGTAVSFVATAVNGGTAPAYQWKLNGANVGSNSSTYTSSALVNGDLIACELVSNATCVSGNTAMSNTVSMTVTPQVTPVVSITASATSICAGTSVTFTATPTNGGTTPAYQWKLNGVNVGVTNNTYSNSALANGDVVSCEMTSNASCAPVATASSNTIIISVTPQVTPSVSIAASSTSICPGTGVTFTATPTNGGSNPVYQWKLNGSGVGTNNNTYINASLVNGDVVTCELTSNANCTVASNATSNIITITVNPQVTPSVNITASSTTICAGTNVTFTASSTNGGFNPLYQWKLNGSNVGTNSSTYSNSAITNGDVVACELTSNAVCVVNATAISNSIAMTVNAQVTPSVTVVATSLSICAGTNVVFTATPVNGGPTPSFQWKLNGVNAGTNTNTYNSSALNNGDVITCEMTSSAACAVTPTVTSNSIAMNVTTPVTPAITIAASSTTICAATSVMFTATPSNGGTSPLYQWKVNGANVGTNSTSYSTSTLNNGDVVTCEMTSNAVCASIATVLSNSLSTVVNSLVTPSVLISASSTTICGGTNVVFTATPANGGTAPLYQWKLNGVNVGGNTSIYSNNTLANGDVVSCQLTSNVNCAAVTTATSNNIAITVTTPVTPSISIVASSTSVCSGTSVSFTAAASNGGAAPAYQWTVNGLNVGTNSNTYVSTSLANGDIVRCVLTSNAACTVVATANSNNVVMSVTSVVPPTIVITASATSICSGTGVTFTATPTNAGTSPLYQWKLNGVNVGTNSNTYFNSALADGDVIACDFTSSSTCFTTTTATASQVMTVYPVPVISAQPDISILPNGQSYLGVNVSGGSKFSYLWTPSIYLNNDTLAKPLSRPVTTTMFNVVVKNEGGCIASGSVKVVVKQLVTISAFSPNGDGINDKWQVADLSSYPNAVVEVYNRRGAVVFRTTNNASWDGTISGQAAPVGTYYYVVNTNVAGQKPVTGWVQLLR